MKKDCSNSLVTSRFHVRGVESGSPPDFPRWGYKELSPARLVPATLLLIPSRINLRNTVRLYYVCNLIRSIANRRFLAQICFDSDYLSVCWLAQRSLNAR